MKPPPMHSNTVFELVINLQKGKSMRLHLTVTSVVFLMVGANPVIAVAEGGTHYSLEGAEQGSFQDARCLLSFNKYGKVWTLGLTPKGAHRPMVNLFFSPKFGSVNAKSGEYPVEYTYRGKAATMGGSVVANNGMYSRDTAGTVKFDRFDDHVAGEFSYTSKNRDGASVTAKGTFDCLRGDALR